MFEQMHAIIPAGESGNARTEHFEVSEDDSKFTRIQAIRRRDAFVPAGKYVRLYANGRLYMSDTPMEQNSNWHFTKYANGDVLVAGLGIGLILVPLFARENVKSITVIERSQDVIDLISPHLQSDKMHIICADIFDWKPTKGHKFDVIYFDIWPDVCEDNLDQMSKLHNRFKFNLNRENPDAFMDSWKREELKYQRQRNKSYRYGW